MPEISIRSMPSDVSILTLVSSFHFFSKLFDVTNNFVICITMKPYTYT